MVEGVIVRPPAREDQAEFLKAVRRSRKLHRPWVAPPDTSEAFRRFLARGREASRRSYLICSNGDDGLVGVVNLSEIVRGNLQSAYLGYYAFEPYSGRGMMRQGMALVIQDAFRKLRLHRLEANIQPGNVASIGLVRSLRFHREGFSPRYLRINGRWKDHERWALLAEDWRS
jgi:ribosomal-protein-alanine N-acetyltransferase